MHLRVNRRRTTRQAYLHLLQCAGLPAHAFGEDGLRLERACDVAELPGFAEGWVSVQDAAAQLAAPLLLGAFEAPVGRPARVLDACAAPGGKTAHLLERADLALTALDLSAKRSARIHANLSRLGLAADVRTADAGDSAAYWDGKPWDAILLDAPCSASGIVRRHPDVPWLRREADVTTIAAVQQRLLTVLWPQLAPGGALLYATCSVFREEGEQSIKTFLGHNTDAQLLRAPGHLLPGIPEGHGAVPDNHSGDHDGFYYALLRKRLA
jgi:16S rRNA (cytosine967-C5)-methyltransferase